MQEQINILVKLQDLDLNIGKIEETKNNYPLRIESLKEKLEEKCRLADSKRDKLESLENERKKKERIMEDEIEKIKKAEAKLLLVKTNKEYQAALKEIASTKESNSQREEEILNVLEELDMLKKELEEQEKDYMAISKEFAKEESELTAKLEEFANQLAEKVKKREELSSKVGQDLLHKYENIKKHRQNIAVVSTKNGFCQGCYMDIPPQLSNEVLKGIDLLFCPNCNRILYWESSS
ncbi:MAG: C4-type zinc ribbon domain-containing protein [Pseudomonadota bacterium]